MSINITALKKVVEVLERKALPSDIKSFNMRSWKSRPTCGTTACALGCAASTKWFQNRGLHLAEGGGIHSRIVYKNSHNGTAEVNWYAVCDFFNLPRIDAEYLFSPDEYKRGRKSDVIRRVKSFIAKNS